MDRRTAFEHVNDSIRALAPEGPDTQTLEFFCECRDIECHALVSLTLLEFAARRAASPPVPILATHEDGQSSRSRGRRLASRGEIAEVNPTVRSAASGARGSR
jgi:hypothetical protein